MARRLDQIDETHDPKLKSWVGSAAGHSNFPIQNLPMGVFRMQAEHGVGVAIGDEILALGKAHELGLLAGLSPQICAAIHSTTLNAWMALPSSQRTILRRAISSLLSVDSEQGLVAAKLSQSILRPQSSAAMLLPANVGDYSDFYAGIHHAYNCGVIFRPEMPLQPNYKHIPVAYHGRSSTLRPSGTPVRRPQSQVLSASTSGALPRLSPTQKMDYEMELAIWIGPGNDLAEPIGVEDAWSHVAGFGLLNDWSARDIQVWESLPLGPFQGKNFMTSLSPWVVSSDAMAPFRAPRMPREAGDPALLSYLDTQEDQRAGGLDIELKVYLRTQRMRDEGAPPHRLSNGQATALWWTPAQMIAHHTVGGCNLRPGDLLGTGTISMANGQDCGCLLEMTEGGRKPVNLPNGETRSFLADGDEVIMTGECHRDGFVSIGFGECKGVVQA